MHLHRWSMEMLGNDLMENKTWIGLGAVAMVLILSGVGYLITDHTFYCQSTGVVMECLRFSSTGTRCYPSLTVNTGYKDCTNWTKLKNEDIINKKEESNYPVGLSYRCDQTHCEVIK
jgi:hypothetical protein